MPGSVRGLGHLAIQYAAKIGYTVVAISRGTIKRGYSLELGVRAQRQKNFDSGLHQPGAANNMMQRTASFVSYE